MTALLIIFKIPNEYLFCLRQPMLASNSWQCSCFSFLSGGISGVSHHGQLSLTTVNEMDTPSYFNILVRVWERVILQVKFHILAAIQASRSVWLSWCWYFTVKTLQICGHCQGLSAIKPKKNVDDTLMACRNPFAYVVLPGFKAVNKFVILLIMKLFNSVFS